MGGTILRLGMALAAASALSAAELPTHVPTYQGNQHAPKAIPKGVPTYRVQPAPPTIQPRLVRPGMNAPRPGVAIPDTFPSSRQRSNKTAQAPKQGGGK